MVSALDIAFKILRFLARKGSNSDCQPSSLLQCYMGTLLVQHAVFLMRQGEKSSRQVKEPMAIFRKSRRVLAGSLEHPQLPTRCFVTLAIAVV